MQNKVKLEDCPVGFFKSEAGELCFKNEYGDSYLIPSGIHFWGGAKTYGDVKKLPVTPIGIIEAAECLKALSTEEIMVKVDIGVTYSEAYEKYIIKEMKNKCSK